MVALLPLRASPDLGLRLGQLDSRLEVPGHREGPVVAVGGVRGARERRPDVDLAERPDLDRGIEDADHLVRLAVEAQRAADDRGIGAEVPRPEAVAQEDDGRGSRAVVRGLDNAAQPREDAPRAEEARRRPQVMYVQGLARPREVAGGAREGGEVVERARLLAPLEEVAVGDALPIARPLRVGGEHEHHPRGVGHGERPQHEEVDEAEDDRVDADGEAERQHDGGTARR
jgi:hypothetical protein